MIQIDENLLTSIIPGITITDNLPDWEEMLEKPKMYWESEGKRYAVFSIDREIISQVKIDSIKKAQSLDLIPLLLVTEHSHLNAISDCYLDTLPHLVCFINDHFQVISPPSDTIIHSTSSKKKTHRTRIPLKLIIEILSFENLIPQSLRRNLNTLFNKYDRLKMSKIKDDYEQKILESFGNKVLIDMGFTEDRLLATSGIRKLELSQLITDRDHFFHSFYNYFLGLLAIIKLNEHYRKWNTLTKLGWEVDPLNVWFLVALWHDVGYGIQKLQELNCVVFDAPEAAEFAEPAKHRYLELPEIQLALKDISSVLPRFIDPTSYKTTWVRPSPKNSLSKKQKLFATALENNFKIGHGTASAFMLHKALMHNIDPMEDDDSSKDVLIQTVLLACCSIPFHDWHFRNVLRKEIGAYNIINSLMPFASTLAFIDSIQEDRRELSEVRSQMRFIERLLVKAPRFVKASLNLRALHNNDVLWKIIEARSVNSILLETDQSLSFKYPPWMIN